MLSSHQIQAVIPVNFWEYVRIFRIKNSEWLQIQDSDQLEPPNCQKIKPNMENFARITNIKYFKYIQAIQKCL